MSSASQYRRHTFVRNALDSRLLQAGRNVVALLGDQVSGTRISLSLKHD